MIDKEVLLYTHFFINFTFYMDFLFVAAGGACGSVFRYLFAILIKNSVLSTFVVNIIGSFLIGILFKLSLDNSMQKLLIIGFCGGFTTFSSFALQNYELLTSSNVVHSFVYVALSVFVSILCVFVGIYLTR